MIPNHHAHINFKLIFELSALSWAIYDHKYELEKAKSAFNAISIQKKHSYVLNLLFVSIANSGFCRLFGGDFGAGVLVFFATFLGLLLRFALTKIKIDLRIQYILCSFVSSWFVFLGLDMGYTNTSDAALGSSILYLIPGIFYQFYNRYIKRSYFNGFKSYYQRSYFNLLYCSWNYMTLVFQNLGFYND